MINRSVQKISGKSVPCPSTVCSYTFLISIKTLGQFPFHPLHVEYYVDWTRVFSSVGCHRSTQRGNTVHSIPLNVSAHPEPDSI